HTRFSRDWSSDVCSSDLLSFFHQNKELPENPILITFDDGDIRVYENGFPVLKKMGLPSVLFIITQLIDSKETFWCRRIERVYERSEERRVGRECTSMWKT